MENSIYIIVRSMVNKGKGQITQKVGRLIYKTKSMLFIVY